jgi:hypothetical protein
MSSNSPNLGRLYSLFYLAYELLAAVARSERSQNNSDVEDLIIERLPDPDLELLPDEVIEPSPEPSGGMISIPSVPPVLEPSPDLTYPYPFSTPLRFRQRNRKVYGTETSREPLSQENRSASIDKFLQVVRERFAQSPVALEVLNGFDGEGRSGRFGEELHILLFRMLEGDDNFRSQCEDALRVLALELILDDVITGAIKWGDANFAFAQLRRLRAHTPWPPP